jgi:predicted transcriptional regulator
MEALALLEKKITELVERANKLREENEALKQVNAHLEKTMEELQARLLSHDKENKENEEERALTKIMVDNLIQEIDAIVEHER